jgi:LmbE family N-acetylglucosaminyl deacetylase
LIRKEIAALNILAIGSHPDDIEINCGGTLLRYKAQGHNIHFVLMTSGNIGSNVMTSREEIARTREAEQAESARHYAATVQFLRYDDEGLQDGTEVRRNLLNAIRRSDPDVIFTHSPTDMSTDHNVTADLVGRLLLSLPGKNVPADVPPIQKTPSLFYWDTPAGHHFEPELYIEISDVMEEKLRTIACHSSQFAWLSVFHHHDLLERVKIQARFRGLQNGYEFAESFGACRMHGYMPDFRLLPL